MTLNAGDPAPDFDLPRDGGGRLSLVDLNGAPAVIYFYPKDDTPGCTKEACGFRDAWTVIQEAGIQVVGVSKDSVKRHDTFKAKYELPFPLLSDGDGTLSRAFGVMVDKTTPSGKPSTSVQRATFLIDADGVIRKVWPKVKVAGHVDDVLAAARELTAA
jgi:peroxiredoxin Q/BCP